MRRTKSRGTRRSGQGSIYQRKDGRWQWGVSTGYDSETGHPARIQGTKPTRAEAAEALNAALSNLRLGLPAKAEKQTLGEFMEGWLRDYADTKSGKTPRHYRQMAAHILPALGHVPLGKLSAQMIQALIGKKIQEGLSARTVGHIRAVLRNALNRAWKFGLIVDNPARKVDLPTVERKEAVYLSVDEAAALKEAAKGHYLGNLITFALNTGLRIGEATGLTWASVDLERKQVKVTHQLQRPNGVGSLMLVQLKTRDSRRTLNLTEGALESLQNQRANRLLWASVLEDADALGLVFTSERGTPLDPRTVDKKLKELAAMAGIRKPVSFHKLRHTAGTHLVANGVPLNVVKEILGHSQISVTADLYAHAVPSAHKAAFDVLEQAYRQG